LEVSGCAGGTVGGFWRGRRHCWMLLEGSVALLEAYEGAATLWRRYLSKGNLGRLMAG